MAYEPLRTLLRSAAELYHRSYRVIDHLRLLEATQYEKIAETIEQELTEISQLPLESLSATALKDADLAEALRPQLISFARWFRQFHEMLVYLPVKDVFPETIDCLKIAFTSEYNRLSPSVILGTLFSAYEFDFLKQIKSMLPAPTAIWPRDGKVVALQLPVCDRYSPTAWAVLSHEMGHSIDTEYGISTSVVGSLGFEPSHRYAHWVEELCADLIAAEFIGPAAILPIISIQHCFYPWHPIHAYSDTHPAALARLQVVSDFIEDKYGFDCLASERDTYRNLWEDSVRQFERSKDQRNVRDRNTVHYEEVIVPIADALRQEIAKRWQSSHDVDEGGLKRCMKRLRRLQPIGAQGDDRETLRDALLQYEKTEFGSVDNQLAAFELLKERFRESPLGIPSLLLSCAKRREEILCKFVDSWRFEAPEDRIQQLCDDIARLDEVGIWSIQASATQRALEESPPGAVSEPQ